jgi:hypothetical protein
MGSMNQASGGKEQHKSPGRGPRHVPRSKEAVSPLQGGGAGRPRLACRGPQPATYRCPPPPAQGCPGNIPAKLTGIRGASSQKRVAGGSGERNCRLPMTSAGAYGTKTQLRAVACQRARGRETLQGGPMLLAGDTCARPGRL